MNRDDPFEISDERIEESNENLTTKKIVRFDFSQHFHPSFNPFLYHQHTQQHQYHNHHHHQQQQQQYHHCINNRAFRGNPRFHARPWDRSRYNPYNSRPRISRRNEGYNNNNPIRSNMDSYRPTTDQTHVASRESERRRIAWNAKSLMEIG